MTYRSREHLTPAEVQRLIEVAEQGLPTRDIQEYLGHKNIQHTVRYTAANRHGLIGSFGMFDDLASA